MLLIASNNFLAKLIKLELIKKNYQVEVVNDDILGLTVAINPHLNLIILDWSITNFPALDICYRLRSTNKDIPILVLTSTKTVSDRINALDAGADDCLSQPFAMTEFLARVRACLRKNSSKSMAIISFSDLYLNPITREVYRGDRSINLTAKEFNLLEYFMIHPQQIITRSQIIEQIWGCDYSGDSNIIEVYIRYLRLKLEANQDKRLIQTVRGIGYTLRESTS